MVEVDIRCACTNAEWEVRSLPLNGCNKCGVLFGVREHEGEYSLPESKGKAQVQVTQDMLESAMKKAVQTGLLPKYSFGETYLKRWEGMKQCIQAAIDVSME